MKTGREKLWYSLLLLVLSLLAFRLSFMIMSRKIDILLLAAGVCMIIAACLIFWTNFRE